MLPPLHDTRRGTFPWDPGLSDATESREAGGDWARLVETKQFGSLILGILLILQSAPASPLQR